MNVELTFSGHCQLCFTLADITIAIGFTYGTLLSNVTFVAKGAWNKGLRRCNKLWYIECVFLMRTLPMLRARHIRRNQWL